MIVSKTPFRISFFGGGTDFPEWYNENGGLVISMAIDKHCYVSLRESPFASSNYIVRYKKTEQVNTINKIEHPSVKNCYKFFNCNKKKLELVHYADIPDRSGIGSSSSFTVGLLNCLYKINNKLPKKRDLALNAINIEQNLIKENVGSQDQVIASYGGFNTIKFSKKKISVSKVNIPKKKINYLTDSIVLLFTGFSRFSSDISKFHKNNIKKNTNMLNEILDIANETNYNLNKKGLNIEYFAKQLNENWKIKRKLSRYVTNDKIDYVYSYGLKNGAIGGKLLGAGGGGFIAFIVDPKYKKKFIKKLDKYLNVPISVDNNGSVIIYK